MSTITCRAKSGYSGNAVRGVRTAILGWGIAVAGVVCGVAMAAEPLVVHEWGTFTEFQDERGFAIGGINTDDEPVPEFVHRLTRQLLERTLSVYPLSPLGKSVPLGFMPVTSRLETPVLYFYPPDSVRDSLLVNVDVQFRGGWVSEYYPNASVDAPGIKSMDLTSETLGSIRWEGLRVGGSGQVPNTTDPVWTTPRIPGAARVVNAEGEAEDYLFYRGVGHFSGPLRIISDGDQLLVESRWGDLQFDEPAQFDAMWLVQVSHDGSLRYRRLQGGVADAKRSNLITSTPRALAESDGATDARTKLHQDMHRALTAAGLFSDEATAMLKTWDRAYFQSPGLRLFYVAPRAWTDYRLPLSVSTQGAELPVHVQRVMVGRIELISDAQRELLSKLKQGPVASSAWVRQIPDTPAREKFLAGRTDFGDLGVAIPEDYQRYLDLGRFRNALLQHELKRRPTEPLVQFAQQYGLKMALDLSFGRNELSDASTSESDNQQAAVNP